MWSVLLRAKIHPLKFKYSVAAGLAASAHLAVDVQDTLAELAGQFMKIERDNLGVKLIQDAAVDKGLLSSDPLYFDATPSTYYDRQSLYADIELKLNEAETQIQVANGRGGVSWILCGTMQLTSSGTPRASSLLRLLLRLVPTLLASPKLDRCFRNARDALNTVERLRTMNVSLYLLDIGGNVSGNGDNPIARVILTVPAALAEWEVSRTAERIRDVKASQREQQRYLGGPVPFGFKVADGRLVVMRRNKPPSRQCAGYTGQCHSVKSCRKWSTRVFL
jgi:Resolvase, N terminal domain